MANIIDNYRRLPIGKYQEILTISRDKELAELDKQVKILSVLSGLEEYEVLNLPIAEYKAMVVASSFLENICKDIPTNIAKGYKFGDMHLVPVMDVRKITTAQYIDFQEWSKGGEANLVQVLSCFLIPKGKKYNTDYDILEVQNLIRENLSVADVLALSAFFLNLYKISMHLSLACSRREAKRIPERERRQMMLQRIAEAEASLNDGDGLPMWMR